ncbi:MAG: class E sortase [Clostridia bacterium]|jgi:LPXTG-site transpeptidase (sortase) family protein
MKRNRGIAGSILIILGLAAMLLTISTIVNGKYVQHFLVQRYEAEVNSETVEARETPVPEMPAATDGPKEESVEELQAIHKIWPTLSPSRTSEEKKEPFPREKYKDGMMIIEIPKIKVQAAVIDGTSQRHLKKGPGLYEISPLPDDEDGNVLIAGHRTTYGAWFRHVDKLKEGDEIVLKFNGREYRYRVERVFIVEKNDWSVTEATGYPAFTLTACHPPRSARQRIVVRARLEDTYNG